MFKYLNHSNIFIIILILNALYACGFKLAGTGEFSGSLENTSVQSNSSSRELTAHIERNLAANQINIVPADQATALLNILREETDRVVLSLDNDGKAREYELVLKVTFEVRSPDNTSLLNQQSVNVSRDYLFEKTELLGSSEEEQQLFGEMRRDLARLIVRRLQNIQE